MAPAMKELSRWLDANSDYCVAPDWADVVKHSGFLPEGKFTRILTEPVCRDAGPRRRGRRPKSGALLSDSPGGMGPLFMNGLIGSMDLVSLQNLRNVPGLPLTGLMGFPHGFTAVPAGEDAKNGMNMLPMMLHGMTAVQPRMFSVGGLVSQPGGTSASCSASSTVVTASGGTASSVLTPSQSHRPETTPICASEGKPTDAPAGAQGRKDGAGNGGANGSGSSAGKPPTEGKSGAISSHAEQPVVTSTSSSSSSNGGSHLTFNPFLIPGMSHGLLYPHMFLPPGGIMALPGMPASEAAGSPKRKRKRPREEEAGEQGCCAPRSASTPPKPDAPAGGTEAPQEAGPGAEAEDSADQAYRGHSGETERELAEDQGQLPEKEHTPEKLAEQEEREEEEGKDAGRDVEPQ